MREAEAKMASADDAARDAAVQVLSNPVIEDVVNVADGEA